MYQLSLTFIRTVVCPYRFWAPEMARRYRIAFLGLKIPLCGPGTGGLNLLNPRRRLVRRHAGRRRVLPRWIPLVRMVVLLPSSPRRDV